MKTKPNNCNEVVDNQSSSSLPPKESGSSDGGTRLDSTVINNTKFIIEKNGRIEPVEYSYVKVIKTNTHIEIHEAEYPFILNRSYEHRNSKPEDIEKDEAIKEDRSDEYRHRTAKRAMDKIRRLAAGNFEIDEIKHLILTFADTENFDITDIAECNKKFYRFAQKLREIDKKYKYIKVAEFQKRGAVHFHVMCNLPYIEKERIEKLWGYGFIEIRKPNYDVSKYLYKYLIKNAGDERFKEKRSWSHSKNMDTPKIYYQKDAYRILEEIYSKKILPNFTYSYTADYNGNINSEEYDLRIPIISPK